ncbi:hypothetical protein HMPREF0569_2517 [Micrococcus luteus SK58]|nr:hypothetical protein HMPREF0569_2517 [Micrococcus luteus SK58]
MMPGRRGRTGTGVTSTVPAQSASPRSAARAWARSSGYGEVIVTGSP